MKLVILFAQGEQIKVFDFECEHDDYLAWRKIQTFRYEVRCLINAKKIKNAPYTILSSWNGVIK